MSGRPSQDTSSPRWLARAGRNSWYLFGIVAVVTVVGFVVVRLSVIVVPVILALFVASVLEPAVAGLRHRRWPAPLAATAVLVAGLAVVVGASAWIATSTAGHFSQVTEHLQQGADDLKRWAHDDLGVPSAQLDRIETQVREALQSISGGGLSRQVIGGARVAADVASGIVLTLFSLFFVLKDGERIAAWTVERAPARHREDLRAIASIGRVVMRQYVIATAATGLIDGVFIGLALWIIGVPLVLPLAVLTFFGGFFPIVGATAAGLVATLVALVSGGTGAAIATLAATVAVQQIEGNLLQPLILGPAVRLHALVTVLAVAGGLAVGGLLGAFLSVPLVALATQVAHFYRVERSGRVTPAEPQPNSFTCPDEESAP